MSYKAEKESEKKIKRTRAKLVAKQRVGLSLMSEVKLEVPVRSRALKPTTRVTQIKRWKNRIIPGTT